MNQEEFIKLFMEFDAKFVRVGLKKTEIIVSLFKIWYDNEMQKWINLRHFNSDDDEHLSINQIKINKCCYLCEHGINNKTTNYYCYKGGKRVNHNSVCHKFKLSNEFELE